jgi:CheY-like chemotaxis protein
MTPPTYHTDSLRILLVDDELCILQILGELLRSDGHTVSVAMNGAQALEQFRSGEWDLVLTDRKMPVMDGEQLAKEIKSISPETPVIMITGFAPSVRCPDVDAIIGKPFTRAGIAGTISTCLWETASRLPGAQDSYCAAA